MNSFALFLLEGIVDHVETSQTIRKFDPSPRVSLMVYFVKRLMRRILDEDFVAQDSTRLWEV